MRILLVSSVVQTSKTGVTTHYNCLLTQLAGRVESVQLITPADTPIVLKKMLGALRRVAALFGPNSRVLYRELENFVSIWATVRWRGASAFDLIHAQDSTSGAAATLARSSKAVPVVVTCHFNDDPATEYRKEYAIGNWTSQLLTNWFQFLFRQPDAFITVSDYTRKLASGLFPQQTPRMVIHNGVVFPPVVTSEQNERLIIANIGTIEERKNQRLLIEAADELRNRGFLNFRVWLLGDGVKRAEWQALVQERNLNDYVSFLGYRPNVMALLPQVSLYVHMALNESWGYTITEAIAAGTPVLALDTGGIPEQFDEHKPGLLPADTNAAELANAILRYHFPDALRRLASQQRQYARERFRLDIMVDKHLDFYRTLLSGPTSPETSAPKPVRKPQFSQIKN